MSARKKNRGPVAYYPGNIEFFKDERDLWRWRVKADNGNIIGASSEGYALKQDAIYNLSSLGLTIVESRDFERFFSKMLKNAGDGKSE